MHRRQQVAQALAPQPVREVGLAGGHPGEVALDGVDLAVVGQQAHRLGQAPLGDGVGAEAAMEEGDGAGVGGVAQVVVELGQHGRAHHALVDDGARRERAHVEVVETFDDALPGERGAYGAAPAAARARDRRRRPRIGRPRRPPARRAAGARATLGERLGAHGHDAPADDGEAFVAQRLLDEVAAEALLALFARQKRPCRRRSSTAALGDARSASHGSNSSPGIAVSTPAPSEARRRRRRRHGARGAPAPRARARPRRGSARRPPRRRSRRRRRSGRAAARASASVRRQGSAVRGGQEVLGRECVDILDQPRPLNDLPRPPGPVEPTASIRRHPAAINEGLKG